MSAELVREQWQAIVDEFTDAIPKRTEKMVASQRGENFPSEERRVVEWRSMAIAMAKEIVLLRDSQKLRERMEALAKEWKQRAHDGVPEDYAKRDMHYKYLKLDNEQAGWDDCADELLAALEAK